MKISNLNFTYGKNIIFQNASVDLDCNKTYALIGRNGIGKTTLFDLIKKNKCNSINYSGIIEQLPQNAHFPHRMKVCEAVEFIRILNKYELNFFEKTLKEISINYDKSIKKFNNIKNTQVQNLSNGELKWLSVILSLTNNSNVYLLDEPTDGVDPEFRYEIWNNINKKSKTNNALFIVSSHLISEMIPYVDEFLFIHNKQILKFKNIDEFNKFFGGNHPDESFVNAYSLN